jgi:uncharacterized protein YndB with AHSA1/START domain
MDVIIHRTARLACEPRQAFRMFTENELLVGWLADTADVEAKVGGRYHVFWDPKQIPNHGTLGCRITAFEPDKLLAFDWRGPDPFDGSMNKADPLTHVTVTFHALPAGGGTEVHLLHTGWAHGEEWDKAQAFFERAWSVAFEALEHKAGRAAP